jgi:hypothetical protein
MSLLVVQFEGRAQSHLPQLGLMLRIPGHPTQLQSLVRRRSVNCAFVTFWVCRLRGLGGAHFAPKLGERSVQRCVGRAGSSLTHRFDQCGSEPTRRGQPVGASWLLHPDGGDIGAEPSTFASRPALR